MKLRCDFFTTIIIAGVLYSGCLIPAAAQNPQCPTRPVGDNTNTCASTAFVEAQIAASGSALIIGTTTITGGASTSTDHGILFNKNGFLGDSANDPSGGPLVVNYSGYTLQPTVAGQTSAIKLSGGQDSVNQGETILEFDTYGANAQGTILFNKSGGGAFATGSISGTTLTATSMVFGTFAVGQIVGVIGGTIPIKTTIVSFGSGTGGVGTYNLSQAGSATPGSTIRTNDAPTSPTAVINGEFLGVVESAGWYMSGSTPIRTNQTAMINFISDGGPFTSTSWPTSIQFLTTPVGSITPGNPSASGDIINPNQQFVILSTGAVLEQINNIGSTIIDGVIIRNMTAATAGVPAQQSPSIHLFGFGWKTAATAASQEVDAIITLVPAQGTSAPTGQLAFGLQVNGGGYTNEASISTNGVFNVSTGFTVGGNAPSGNVLRGNGTNFIAAQLACADLVTPCITTNQTITVSGDLTGTGTTAITATLATVNANIGTFGSATQSGTFTVNAKGLITAASGIVVTPAVGSITGLAVGIATFLATPSSANLAAAVTDETGTAGNLVFSGSPTLATPTFTTSFTSPLHVGGSGAGSTLTLETTSGAGTTDALIALTASQQERWRTTSAGLFGIGTNNPQSLLHVSKNVTQNVAAASSAIAQFVNVDGTPTDVQINAFGTGIFPRILMRQSRGTAASQTATGATDLLFLLSAQGWDATNTYVTSGAFHMTAGSAFTNTSHETFASISTTANGSIALGEVVRVFGSGGLAVGGAFGTDPGAGSALLNAQFFMPNITQTSAAQTGTVCWTTGTGKFTVDTTVGCLTSIGAAKNITSRPTPKETLAIVDQLSAVAFRYKAGWGDSGHYEQFGLIADEVAQIDERLAGRDPNGTLQGVRYQELTAVLAGAIKQLKADNDNLQTEVDQLKRSVIR